MELNINSPAYFTNHYGVDDEVYRYCQNLHNYFKTKEYSETLTIIGITPIVAPKEVYNQGLWKEKVQIVSLGTCAMIDVRMDFESYYNADSDGKIQLIEEMLIKAIKKVKTKGKFDLELQAVEHEEITEFNPKAKIAVFLVLIGFALDIVAMYVFKLTGGDAAALLGGTAVLLIIIINIMNFNKKCFEQTCDNIIEGFVFGIKIFAAIIPIAAFFYMGEVAPITAVLGEVLPSGSQGLLSDMGVALSNTIPLNKFAVCSIQTVVGAITGLDGSGFSGISLVGSLANVFGTAVNGSVGALCALGQIAGIWTGGGCLVPWGLISAAAICGVSPIELAKRNLKPILIGFAVTTIVAIFII